MRNSTNSINHLNNFIANEAEILKNVQHKSLPVLLDSFQLDDGRKANVMRRIEDGYDLYSLREYFPEGLNQKHVCWVLERLLSVLGFLHINNVVHGAIEPGNIIVTPENHNGFLIDFLLSIPDAASHNAKYVAVNDYSAPEIRAGVKPHPSSDMYSLGKSMVYLIGGDEKTLEFPSDVDPTIVRFIRGFLKSDPAKRANDAWKYYHKLRKLRDELFGADRPFEELKISDSPIGYVQVKV